MPLRDHFRPPLKKKRRWEGLHAGWPMMIVRSLFDLLPKGYVAEPGVHLGKAFEIDVSTYSEGELTEIETITHSTNGGVAVAAPPKPTLTFETDLPDQHEYDVRVYDVEYDRRLVAAIEIVSPANKDRPESRRAFIGKIAALLQKEVCVSIIDLVTIRHFNLYEDLLQFVGVIDQPIDTNTAELYSFTIRTRKRLQKGSLLDTWYYPMTLGQPLPTLPIWLNADESVMLPLELGYEETCRLLHIS